MTDKRLIAYGFAGAMQYPTAAQAAYYTYQTRDGRLVPTPLDFPGIDRVMHAEVLTALARAKAVLEIGCGIGRNVPWLMEHSDAHYYGIEPNRDMFRFFWDVTDRKYAPRVTLSPDFDILGKDLAPDVDIVLTVMALQHLAIKPPPGAMDIHDITREAIRRTCHPGTLWVHFESECDGPWLDAWVREFDITPLVYVRNYAGLPELNHRLSTHHLIIWRVTEAQCSRFLSTTDNSPAT